ncbi:hypothetical protein JCM10212_001095 [Sporobolomyces blumeae]
MAPGHVLLGALAHASPSDCARFSRTCKAAHTLCSTWTLWRDLHRDVADPPPAVADGSEWPFRLIVERYTHAQSLLGRLKRRTSPEDNVLEPEERVALLESLVHFARTRPLSGQPLSRNEAFLDSYDPYVVGLLPSFARTYSPGGQDRLGIRAVQLAAELHSLATPDIDFASAHWHRTSAREIVYERQNFTRSSWYGPLESNKSGRVDWRCIEALSMCMRANIEDARVIGWGEDDVPTQSSETVVPEGWKSTRRDSAGPAVGRRPAKGKAEPDAVDPRDWAGVTTHEWRGTYAFLDYRRYHNYNAHRTSETTLAEDNEAVGDCMSLRLELVPEGQEDAAALADVSSLSSDDDGDADDDDYDDDALDLADSDSSDSDSDASHFPTAPLRGLIGSITEEDDFRDPRQRPMTGRLPLPTDPSDAVLDGDSMSSTSCAGPPPPPVRLPLPLPTASSNAAFPKLAFKGTSMPLALRPLAFTGTFRNSQNDLSSLDRTIRGTVEMNDAGEVIWKYIIRYGGADQWALTGVQVGGPRSAHGVVGTWSCADREAADTDGPHGPFWYWPHLETDEEGRIYTHAAS